MGHVHKVICRCTETWSWALARLLEGIGGLSWQPCKLQTTNLVGNRNLNQVCRRGRERVPGHRKLIEESTGTNSRRISAISWLQLLGPFAGHGELIGQLYTAANMGSHTNVQCPIWKLWRDLRDWCSVYRGSSKRGRKMYYGEYLPNAQGEDVVAGVRSPNKLA